MRLGRGMTIFIAVDAVLVTVFLVMLALAVTGGLAGTSSASTTAGTPSPGVSAPGAVAPSGSPSGSTAPQALESFALPSGNIACTMSESGAKCTIASITFTPPTDAACTGSIGHVFEVGADGVRIPCVDGPAPGVAADGTPQLEYGTSSTVGGYTCSSSTNGVRCVEDATGRGFELARSKYAELP
ncbi:hypothetical protein DDP54_01635 [Cellulomonas sp. WB94]|nr:hypothetical protein DDP54_01635 [Cellulomonas sp. WB94]